jgi:hypothetical protein
LKRRGEDGKGTLCVSAIDRPNPRTLLDDPCWITLKDWSPDGRWPAVAQFLSHETSKLALVRVEDGRLEEVKRLTDEELNEAIFRTMADIWSIARPGDNPLWTAASD